MASDETFTLTVNGKRQTVHALPEMPLLWALRQEVGISGVKFGCGAGLCGACTVQLDGVPTRACLTPLNAVGKRKITTVEGLSQDPVGARLQKAWVDVDVMQCGYCQAGQLMTAHALLKSNPKPNPKEVDEAMEGNICRCACYPRIRAAIRKASGQEALA